MPSRTLEAVAFWPAVTAAALLLAGAAGKPANTGEPALRPLALGLAVTVLAVSHQVWGRAALPPEPGNT